MITDLIMYDINRMFTGKMSSNLYWHIFLYLLDIEKYTLSKVVS